MKPNIVFDMGQVLMDFAPPKFIARLGYTGDDAQALLQEVFKGWEWVAFDRGTSPGRTWQQAPVPGFRSGSTMGPGSWCSTGGRR